MIHEAGLSVYLFLSTFGLICNTCMCCFLQQSVGRDITKMFNEDLFKLDTSVVPAAIRYIKMEHVSNFTKHKARI